MTKPTPDPLARGDEHRVAKRYEEAIVAYEDAAAPHENPDAGLCLKLARCCVEAGRAGDAVSWLRRLADATESFLPWQAGGTLLGRIGEEAAAGSKRRVKLAVLGSYTTVQLVPMLRLAALRRAIDLGVYEAEYGQFQQEILDPSSGLYAFEPDVVLLAVHAGEVILSPMSTSPEDDLETAVTRWTGLWRTLGERCAAQIVMHNFVVPLTAPMGHLATRLPGARSSMIRTLNTRLGEVAGNDVLIVDCERLASELGKRRWFDDRYWHISKQAVSLDALPSLARHTMAVIAGGLGLSRKCLVLDLDNTLWGGVIGEDGLAGIRLGQGSPEGEAFQSFQEYVLELKHKGIILAVCSKNNDADAREPFEQHPDMRIKLDDITMFAANWDPKPENLRRIAETINIGLDALVFVDDNPAEREIVRRMVPEVEVVTLPPDPSGYVRALDAALHFETNSFTAEDSRRTEQYKARAEIARLEAGTDNLEDFHRSLRMTADVEPFDDLHLPRIVQLIGKTNQFNLTTRRHTMETVRGFIDNPSCVHFYLKLCDRFTDHGLVSLLIALKDGQTLDIDTWLMSCRVIGRTVEVETLARLCREARHRDCTAIRGTYVPTAKNMMVKDVYGRFGFEQVAEEDGTTTWLYQLDEQGPITSDFIATPETASDPA